MQPIFRKTGNDKANFNSLTDEVNKKSNFTKWGKDFIDFLYRNHFLELFRSNSLNETSQPGESERDFKSRIQLKSREERDEWIEKIRDKYAKKTESIQTKIRRAEERIAREEAQSSQQKLQTVISFGATILGAFLGRKAVSTSTVNKAGTAIRTAGRAVRESQDVARAKEEFELLKSNLLELEEELKLEIESQSSKFDIANEELERFQLYPKKKDIDSRLVALVWVPQLKLEDGSLRFLW